MKRCNAKDLSADRDEKTPLRELTTQPNVVRREREYPSRMGYAPRHLNVCLFYDSRRQL
jgi:hypothetical protein